MKKLSVAEKIARGMALSVPELMVATGYSRKAIKRMDLPLVQRKMRLSDFWQHLGKIGGGVVRPPDQNRIIGAGAAYAAAWDQPGLQKSNVQQDASPYRVGLQPS